MMTQDIPTSFLIAGQIIATNMKCDCGHNANEHEQFEGSCQHVEDGKHCMCPFHSYSDQIGWDRRHIQDVAVERITNSVSEALDEADRPTYFAITNESSGWRVAEMTEEASPAVQAALELRNEWMMNWYDAAYM